MNAQPLTCPTDGLIVWAPKAHAIKMARNAQDWREKKMVVIQWYVCPNASFTYLQFIPKETSNS
jgi:hypothetical protein